jgi:hypothetical protein
LQPDQKFESSDAILKDGGGVQCLFKDPPTGHFDVTCDLTRASDNSTTDTLATTSGKGITLLNSQTIKPVAVAATSGDNKTYSVRSDIHSHSHSLRLLMNTRKFDKIR